jgi:hypothetical protein
MLLGFGLAPQASAQTTLGEQAFFTLTEPMDVGGTILPAGDYQIKTVPALANRNLLQVWSGDQTTLFTTLLTVPHHEGNQVEEIPESRYLYYPASDSHIRALRTWFDGNTPGSGGHDIVYPRQRAMELAALAKEPVVAVPDEVKVAEYETAPLVVVTPEKEVKPYEVAKVEKKVAPVEPIKVAEVRPEHERLPQTASNIPLYAGLGLLSLLGALGLGVIARRVA